MTKVEFFILLPIIINVVVLAMCGYDWYNKIKKGINKNEHKNKFKLIKGGKSD